MLKHARQKNGKDLESSELESTFIGNTSAFLVAFDRQGSIHYRNETFSDLVEKGKSKSDTFSLFWDLLSVQQEREELKTKLSRMSVKHTYTQKLSTLFSDNKKLSILWTFSLSSNQNSPDPFFTAVGIDLGEFPAEEFHFGQAKEELNKTYGGMDEGVMIIDRESKNILWSNPAVTHLLGFSNDSLKRFVLKELFPKEKYDYVNDQFVALQQGFICFAIDIPFLQENGSVITLDVECNTTNYMDRQCLILFLKRLVNRSLTPGSPQKPDANPSHTRCQLQRLRQALEQHSIITITDTDHRIIYVNDKLCELSNYSRDELLGQNHKILYSENLSDDFYEDLYATIQQGNVWHGEVKNRGKDGSLFWLETSVIPFRDMVGNIIQYITIHTDITECIMEKDIVSRHQKQLIHADKMTSLGILVSGMAHEINNPNNFIMSNAPLLTKIWDDLLLIMDEHIDSKKDLTVGGLTLAEAKDAIPKLLSGISDGSHRIKRIVEGLRDFSRKGESRRLQPTHISEVIDKAIVIVNSLIKKKTHNFSVKMQPDLPMVPGNFHELEQVIINLITNSCHSLSSKNESITISCSYDRDADRVVIAVVDQGVGIPEKNLEKIMDPFFTTKKDTGGTGLGLSVSFGIILNHGGSLNFDSKLGEGTTAKISLPAITNRSSVSDCNCSDGKVRTKT